MPEYPYRATVIVPVYNVEAYLRGCLDSLTAQTMPGKDFEVLMLNDGSTDQSESICEEYCGVHANFKLRSKENEGLSATRNLGLELAEGKYIFFLDSDDRLAPDTLKSVADFFDSVYDKTDLVTYRITQYFDGRPIVNHFRYMTLVKQAIYDLKDPGNRFITQTNINICVKNGGNIRFCSRPNFLHEDEKFCCDVVREKMTIGYCSKGEYIYNRNNAQSIVSSRFTPELIFDASFDFYEELFGSFPGSVPAYFGALVFNDLRWQLKENKLLPRGFEPERWRAANERIDRLLMKIDEDTIILHPSVDIYQMLYWLSRKRNSFPTVVSDGDSVSIFAAGRMLFRTSVFEARLTGGKKCCICSPVFTFLERGRYRIYTQKNGDRTEVTELGCSGLSKLGCDESLAFFPEFNISFDPELKVVLEIDSFKYAVKLGNKE